jgi:hypothetical protein
MDDHATIEPGRDYRLIGVLAVLCIVLILTLREGMGGPTTSAPALAPTAMPLVAQPHDTARSAAPATAPSAGPVAPFDIGDQPVGAWHLADSGVGIQLQIRKWTAAAARAVLYISAGRPSATAIYEGRVMQRTRTTATLSVGEQSATRLPGAYAWCRRLTGTITSTIRDGVGMLEIAPVCTDATGRGIINPASSRPTNPAIPSILLDSGARILQLGHAPG